MLDYAIEATNLNAINLLLSYSADPNIISYSVNNSNGIPLIFKAASKGYYDVVMSLVKRGADVYIVDERNYNILTYIIKDLNKFSCPSILDHLNTLINLYYLYLFIFIK